MCRVHIPEGNHSAVHQKIAQAVINDNHKEIYSYVFLNYNQGMALKFFLPFLYKLLKTNIKEEQMKKESEKKTIRNFPSRKKPSNNKGKQKKKNHPKNSATNQPTKQKPKTPNKSQGKKIATWYILYHHKT